MLSIIVCSKYAELSKTYTDNIASTTGIPFEIIHIDNSGGQYSIFEAYNKGIAQSNFPYLCFVHEDVFFRTDNWGNHVINHLQDNKTGIIGIAGSETVSKVPFTWTFSGVFQQWIYNNGKETRLYKSPQDPKEVKNRVVLLDGVFFCMRKDLTEKIRFDENMQGFHGYDLDISFQSHAAGYQNYMIFDVLIEHLSSGNKTRRYYQNLIALYRKWESILPLHLGTPLSEVVKRDLETRKLKILVTKLAKRSFAFKEIKEIYQHYLPYTHLAANTRKASRFLLKTRILRMIFFFGKIYYK